MSLTSKSTIPDAIEVVARTLERAGISAILVGGACATIYSGGSYLSQDLDLILKSAPSQRELDAAMASIGFTRQHAQYFHEKSDIFVEFPKGPLSIGNDLRIIPTRVRVGRFDVSALSPTDSCRDRLAAFYHWGDRQSLDVAVAIALRHRVDLKAVHSWSNGEGAQSGFEEFKRELARARRRRAARSRTGSGSRSRSRR